MNIQANLSLDETLKARAARVIPGGMWGHQNVARLPSGYPQYFKSASGSRITDVNGREYIDYMCGWGPIILGHNDPDVEAAAATQRSLGDCFNGPSERAVELAELLVGLVPHADWALFSKNGSDATTTCVTIARAGTGRRKIVLAKGAYHGAVPWCSPSLIGVTAEDRTHLIYFEFGNAESLEQACAQAGDDLAAILVSAFKHDLGKDQMLPTPSFARRARELADARQAALIIDEVRAGFRLNLGGSWEGIGVRPDLSAWSKALGNGHPIAAVTGNDRFREAATKIFVTGSFWTAAVPMAAAIATLSKLRGSNAIAKMEELGSLLRNGLAQQAARHGFSLRQTGPVQMPAVLFDGDADYRIGQQFCLAALRRGIYFHPTHTMFLSAAHTEQDIEETLAATGAAFGEIASLIKR